jgi:hypothetical protein
VVDQIIAYEKDPPADPSCFKRMIFAAYFQGSGHKDTRGYLTTIPMTIAPLYIIRAGKWSKRSRWRRPAMIRRSKGCLPDSPALLPPLFCHGGFAGYQ